MDINEVIFTIYVKIYDQKLALANPLNLLIPKGLWNRPLEVDHDQDQGESFWLLGYGSSIETGKIF